MATSDMLPGGLFHIELLDEQPGRCYFERDGETKKMPQEVAEAVAPLANVIRLFPDFESFERAYEQALDHDRRAAV